MNKLGLLLGICLLLLLPMVHPVSLPIVQPPIIRPDPLPVAQPGSLAKPDLTASLTPVPLIGAAGEDNELRIITENIGNAYAGPSTTKVKIDGANLQDVAVPGLAPMGPLGGRIYAYNLTYFCRQVGTVTLTAAADYYNRVDESNENNNKASVTITCILKPNLKVTIGSSYIASHKVRITVTTLNGGKAPAGPSLTTLTMFKDSNNPVRNAIYKEHNVLSLKLGQTDRWVIDYKCEIPGEYILYARADASNQVDESYETDNSARTTLTCR